MTKNPQRPFTQGNELLLVDASIYIFQSWFALPETIVDGEGESINAVYGFVLFLSRLLNLVTDTNDLSVKAPIRIALAFDESLGTCFRNQLYPLYKSSRGLPDENLAYQLSLCRKLSESIGLKCFSSKHFEADDLIGSLAKQFIQEQTVNKPASCVFVTRDKDLGQLLTENDILWDMSSRKVLNPASFYEKHQVHPEQFTDFLALVGDNVDDIPGVSGLGAKTAVQLLKHFRTIDHLYDEIKSRDFLLRPELDNIRGLGRMRDLLIAHKSVAFLSKQLATIRTDLSLIQCSDELAWNRVSAKRLRSALTRAHIVGQTRKTIEGALQQFY